MVEQNDSLSQFEYCDNEWTYKKTLVAINNICMSNENLSYAMNLYINDILIVKCDNFIASSSIKFLGTIIIAPKKHWKIIDYMENLIHEMSHIDLYIKQLVDPLVISKNLIKSPFRNYNRPVIGVLILMTVPILLVPYTNEVLHAGTDTFAALEALYSAGVLLGGFFSPILCRIISMKNTIFCLLVIMAFSLFFLSKNSNTFLAYPIYFLVGFGLSSWALSITLAQIMSDPAYQGRLQSTFNGLSGIGILTIYLLMNYQGKNIDVQNIYFWEFLLAIFAAIFVIFFRNKEAVHEK
ncbi:MFS transporter [Photorhabdus heterorhabditis]|uniref:MFS transporter n=1 Tax=Photorhabdus heterorhabditis TaxID=880156 RepID=UPI001BD2E4C8|nr:MFS transporter [Photorhabdus heterorhabditis]MBS9440795.1 MFS transporter [Photorhabdus heterorhabditis]